MMTQWRFSRPTAQPTSGLGRSRSMIKLCSLRLFMEGVRSFYWLKIVINTIHDWLKEGAGVFGANERHSTSRMNMMDSQRRSFGGGGALPSAAAAAAGRDDTRNVTGMSNYAEEKGERLLPQSEAVEIGAHACLPQPSACHSCSTSRRIWTIQPTDPSTCGSWYVLQRSGCLLCCLTKRLYVCSNK